MNTELKRLYRSRRESQIGGVCAGLGFYFGMDPVIMRLLVVALTLVTGVVPGAIFYLVAWIVVPPEAAPEPAPATPVENPQTGQA